MTGKSLLSLLQHAHSPKAHLWHFRGSSDALPFSHGVQLKHIVELQENYSSTATIYTKVILSYLHMYPESHDLHLANRFSFEYVPSNLVRLAVHMTHCTMYKLSN